MLPRPRVQRARPVDDVRAALTIFVKDMGLVTEAAEEAGQQVPLATSAQDLYRRGSALGWDRRDDSIVYELLRRGGTTT